MPTWPWQAESLADVGRSLERWVAGAVVRTYAQRRLRDLALATSSFRVINALSDEEHPCQALADCLTLKERWGETRGRRVAFVGDGGNVATSFAQAAAMLGITVHVASPEGFELPAEGRRGRRARWPAAEPSSGAFAIRAPRCAMSTPSTRTSGPRWARRRRSPSAGACSVRTR